MKKIGLLIILAVFAYETKAQQLFPAKPADSLKNDVLDNYIKTMPNTSLWSFSQPFNPLNSNQFVSVVNTNVSKSPYDGMPVANLQGNSKMPVVKLDGYSKMPILKLGDGGQITVPPIAKTP